MSEKRSEFSEMSDVSFAADLIRQVEPRRHMSVKEWITVTARRLGWPYSRAKAVWYEDARRIDAAEMDALRAAIRARETRKLAHDHHQHVDRIARLKAALAVVDEEFHGEQIAGMERQLRRRGDVDRA
ncbi:MAG: hypothetical protein PS018_18700 [bacterium]|nr:hypothetical protein [bacterium]